MGDNTATQRNAPVQVRQYLSTDRLSAGVLSYFSSGTFTSSVIDIGTEASFTTLSYNTNVPALTALTVDVRAGNTSIPDSTWTAWQSSVASGGDISALTGNRYVQYRVNLSTTNALATPSFNDISINYAAYSGSGTVISSPYNTTDASNAIGGLSWDEDVTLPSGTGVTVSLRTGATISDLNSASWTDFTNATTGCTKTNSTVVCGSSAIPAAMKNALNNQWYQYKVTLISAGANTPTVTNVKVIYVVNAPPQFDQTFGTNGVSVSQIASSTDPNLGQVLIQYKVRDVDTTTGSSTPGFITPSFEYNIGSGWVAVDSSKLDPDALTNKAVSESAYNTYQAVWNAKAQIPDTFSNSTQIRVTANDNEPVNNITQAVGPSFTLDTKNPTGTLALDASDGSVAFTGSDDSNLSYLLSNNSDGSADGLNALSNGWTNVNASSTIATSTWSYINTGSYPIVNLFFKDSYNNTSTVASMAPSKPAGMDLKDISNSLTGVYKEFLSWGVYTSTSTAAFSKYEIFRSTDNTNFSLLNTITDPNLNYYVDSSVASTTTYSYKVRIVDTDNDKSAYSSVVSDLPNGQGGTDVTPPVISAVAAAEVQSTWAKITWTTDEVSDSKVEYSVSPDTYDSSLSSASIVTNHSVTLTNLSPGTTYYFRVKSADIYNNSAVNDNNGSGFSFTTSQGPKISSVTAVPGDRSAVITWNTDKSSNSYVFYSTDSGLSGALTAGNAAMVATSSTGSLFEHKVALPNLSPSTIYYYYVSSADDSGDISTDKNSSSYYSFRTTNDINAPVITNLSAPVNTSQTIVAVWNTDEPATTRLAYGTKAGDYATVTDLDATLTTVHVVVLNNLTASTKYFFVAKSSDEAGNEAVSKEQNITTAADNQIVSGGGGGYVPPEEKDTTPPVISDINTDSVSAFGAVISFSTDEAAMGFVEYGTSSNYDNSSSQAKFLLKHTIKINGLRMGTTYKFHVKAVDKAGNEAVSEEQTFTTKYLTDNLDSIKVDNLEQYQDQVDNAIESIVPSLVPPFVGKVQVTDITEDSATVNWETNLKAYSTVNYTPEDSYKPGNEKPYLWEASDTANKSTDHQIILGNLQPNTRYHFKVSSFTLPQVVGSSKDLTFVTKAEKFQASAADIKTTSFKIVWTTKEPVDSVVEYRNLSTNEINRKVNNTKQTLHEETINNLSPATAYEVKVFGQNEKGNMIEAKRSLKVVTGKDVTPPVISGLKIESAIVPNRKDRAQTSVIWKTDEASTSAVYYEEGGASASNKGILANKAETSDDYSTNHVVVLTTLKPGSIYRIQVESKDEAGNVALYPVKTIIVPKENESVSDVIFKNFEDAFKFLRNGN